MASDLLAQAPGGGLDNENDDTTITTTPTTTTTTTATITVSITFTITIAIARSSGVPTRAYYLCSWGGLHHGQCTSQCREYGVAGP